LVDEIAAHGIKDPFWTFGGGTVLMLRYGHRLSKDIDIFVPDPQYLGFVSPRLSDVAEGVSDQYVEGPGYIKLLRPEGEIDFVASPNLTAEPFELWELLGRPIKVETSAEIVAKKLWHRGDRATARDLFDLVCTWTCGPRPTCWTSTRRTSVWTMQMRRKPEPGTRMSWATG
jgi:predicted nucleotidyltransferase component of viral defense system